MLPFLPSHPGLLPYWQLLISAFSLLNATQCYRSREHALRTYSGPYADAQLTEYGARVFGTWSALSCIVRFYAAYNIENEGIYKLAFWSYLVALTHFGVEWLRFRTMSPGIGLWRVGLVPAISIPWMIMQWDYYVKAL